MCSRPLASARSVPGVTCRCSAARRAVGVSRGSITISAPPRSAWSDSHGMNGGMVSAALLPASRMTSAPAMSATGNGSPRSRPNARSPAAAAEDMQNRPL